MTVDVSMARRSGLRCPCSLVERSVAGSIPVQSAAENRWFARQPVKQTAGYDILPIQQRSHGIGSVGMVSLLSIFSPVVFDSRHSRDCKGGNNPSMPPLHELWFNSDSDGDNGGKGR